MNTYEGIIEEIIFHNENNGYTVCTVNVGGSVIPIVGKIFFIRLGETIRFRGDWTKHPQYGEQISITFYEKVMPSSAIQVEEYLSSGIIKGVGAKIARKIVKKFGEETINIIKFSPQKLTEIKGISYDKAMLISEEFEIQKELNELLSFFNQHNIPGVIASKVYKKLYGASIEVIRQNPYILMEDEYGLSFKTVDSMAIDMGMEKNSEERICGAIKYFLIDASNSGHTYVLENELKSKVTNILNVQSELVESSIISLAVRNEIYIDRNHENSKTYLYRNYLSESYTAFKISQLADIRYEIDEETLMGNLKKYEEKENISFAQNQILAIKEAMQNGVVVITGGPGTGKTTIIKAIIYLFEIDNKSVILTAPTGRATKRMTESTGKKAKTIHRLLEIEFAEDNKEPKFGKNENNPLNTEVVIIDETSMVDINIMASLMRAITFPTRIVVVGDIDQLPAVGPGNVLKDMIECEKINTVKLNDIFRQAHESMIVVNAHRINSGELPINNIKGSDFYFIRETMLESALKTVVDLYNNRLPAFYGFEPLKDIQVITPTRKGVLGVMELNKELQKIINPPSKIKNEKKYFDVTFRVGDRVMQTKNNYKLAWLYKKDLYKEIVKGYYDTYHNIQNHFDTTDNGQGIFNGDTGIIVSIDKDDDSIKVVFDDDREVLYDNTCIDQLEHAYSVTVHKSQGSEFPAVIIPVMDGPKVLFTRNLLYTAVTRAKNLVVIVGSTETIRDMVNNNLKSTRFSSLKDRIIIIANHNV